jgi:hypothetical protein
MKIEPAIIVAKKYKIPISAFCIFAAIVTILISTLSNNENLDFDTPDGAISYYKYHYDKLEEQTKGTGIAYGKAMYRLSQTGSFIPPSDDFPTDKILQVVTDRHDEPAPGTEEWAKVVVSLPQKYKGLDVRDIVNLYITNDTALLNEQDDWAKSYEDRVLITNKKRQFEEMRRSSIFNRITPRLASFRWTNNEPRRPVLDFTMLNPLDKSIKKIGMSVDLRTPNRKIAGSGKLEYQPNVPLSPGITANFIVSAEENDGLNNRKYMDLKTSLSVSLRIDYIETVDNEFLSNTPDVEAEDSKRKDMVHQLRDAIRSAKINLFAYKKAFLK